MTKLWFLIFSLLVSVESTTGQSLNKPILLGENSPYFEDTDMLFHSLERTQEMFRNDPNAYFAVRVCSNNPLPVAFSDAAGVGYGVRIVKEQLNYLRKYERIEIPESNIFFLRNDKGCRLYKGIALTEYWFISSNADFPAFIEIKQTENITTENIISSFEDVNREFISTAKSDDFVSLTPDLYESFKPKLVEFLRKDKTAYVLIKYIITSGRNKRLIYNNAVKLQTYLTGNNVGKHRIFLKECVIGCAFDPDFKNTLYPEVIIIYQK